jgi:UDP-N-acetylglucosamine--N-acetylmuramyl-(pentapeptide) pyrophosphoryl-undecaprenol N-acetylglucosamine transferase
MVGALPYLAASQDRLEVTHQTGETELESVRAEYRRIGFPARVEPYLDAMDREYAECDLVVSRAGATTCAELAAAGRASILVPLPLAGAHQEDNARMMVREDAACMLTQEALSGESLARTILELLDEPERRRAMAQCARALARPDAARIIVEQLLQLAGRAKEARE